MSNLLRNKGLWIGLLVSAVSLIFFVRGIQWDEFFAALGQTKYLYLFPAALINIFSLWLRSVRWHYLLRHLKGVRVWPLFIANAIGFMGNMLLPARLGEFARAFVIGQREQIPMSSCLASVVVERLFDFVAVLVLFGAVLASGAMGVGLGEGVQIPDIVFKGGMAAVTASLVMIVGLLVLTRFPAMVQVLFEVAGRFLPERTVTTLRGMVENFISGIHLFEDWTTSLIILFYSLLMWFFFVFSGFFVMYAFDIWNFSFIQLAFLVVTLAFAIMVPSGPGYVGVYHYACGETLKIILGSSATAGTAGAMAVVFHLVSFIPLTSLGLTYMYIDGLSFGELQRRREEKG